MSVWFLTILLLCGIWGVEALAEYAPAKATKLQSIKLNKASLSLEHGQDFQLQIGKVKPASIMVDQSLVRWTSSNTSVVSVSASGWVSCIGKGSATITCEYAGKKARCKFKTKVPLSAFSLNKTSLSIGTGGTSKLKPKSFEPSDTTSKKKPKWSSSNTAVASVSSGGAVRGKRSGSAVISCTIDGITANCEVRVLDKEYAYIQAVLELVNKERAKQGRAPLQLYQPLNAAAYVRAKELKRKFSHTRPNGSLCVTAIPFAFAGCGENIAYGYRTPASVMNGWMHSTGHRKNILNDDYTHIGIGYYYANGRAYWVQMFLWF